MEWKKGDKYFFKLNDGSVLTGEIIGLDNFGNYSIIKLNDKFGKTVGFREDQIMKYELLTKVNKVNNSS